MLKVNGTVPSRREPSSNDTGRLSGARLSRETQSYTDGSGTLLLIGRLSQRLNPQHADYTAKWSPPVSEKPVFQSKSKV